MKFIKSFALFLALSTSFTARAQSFDWQSIMAMLLNNSNNSGNGENPTDQLEGIDGLLNGEGDSDALMNIAFDAAYLYASSDPQYAGILMALNINSGDDLQAFLMNDDQNFSDIIAHLALAYASDNPEFAQWFNQVGVTNHASLKSFMKTAKYRSTVHKMALVQARGDENYSQWLSQLGINDVSDIQALLNGEGGGLSFESLWPLAEQYVQTNYPEYAQFLPLVEQFLGIGGASQDDPSIDLPVEEEPQTPDSGDTDETDDTDDTDMEYQPVFPVDEDGEVIPPEVVGAYRGLPLSEVKAIQESRGKPRGIR